MTAKIAHPVPEYVVVQARYAGKYCPPSAIGVVDDAETLLGSATRFRVGVVGVVANVAGAKGS